MKFDILGWLLFSFIFLNTSSSLLLFFLDKEVFILSFIIALILLDVH
jgi:hypothetical protein